MKKMKVYHDMTNDVFMNEEEYEKLIRDKANSFIGNEEVFDDWLNERYTAAEILKFIHVYDHLPELVTAEFISYCFELARDSMDIADGEVAIF